MFCFLGFRWFYLLFPGFAFLVIFFFCSAFLEGLLGSLLYLFLGFLSKSKLLVHFLGFAKQTLLLLNSKGGFCRFFKSWFSCENKTDEDPLVS